MYMLKNILQNLVNDYATRPYPYEVREPLKGYRGLIYNQIEDCIFCSSCARKCPTDAINVDPKEGLWIYDPFLCVYCSACVDICPTHCLKQEAVHRKPSVSKFLVQKQGTPPKKKAKKGEEEEG